MASNYVGISDTGMVRSNNEDAYIAGPVQGHLVACVIDGVGGYEGGEIAANLARAAFIDTIEQNKKGPALQLLKLAFENANRAIILEKQKDSRYAQMACVASLALLDVDNNKFYFAHVGDTRLYLFRDGSLIKVSHDHSFVGFLEESGRLSEDAAMNHVRRNEINRALGFDADMGRQTDYVETGESPFLPGDMLLLCSDGLTDLVNNSAISKILAARLSVENKARMLVDAANTAGGKDNITVVLVVNDKVPQQHEATRPAAITKQDAQPAAAGLIQTQPDPKPVFVDKKKKNSAVPVLSVLCLLLVAAIVWLLYRQYRHSNDAEVESALRPPRERLQQEQALADSLRLGTGSEVFILNTAASQPVMLTAGIVVKRDSLHIIGNGVTLRPAEAFKGPALIFDRSCRYTLLDSVVLENFDIGVLMSNKSLQLKNVQFKNCRIPVQQQYFFPQNVLLNGAVSDLFYTVDSVQTDY